jgi:tRNA threonylcarbamoyl adenosine modification protein YeaZ
LPSDAPLILAFDTSAAHCAAAVVRGDATLSARSEPMARGQAERLAPMLEEVLAEAGAKWSDLAALAVCTGPGNFTGLRIATGLARGLAMGLGVPAIGVTLFEALASERPGPVVVTLESRAGGVMIQPFRDGSPEDAPRLAAPENAVPVPPGAVWLGHGAAAFAARHGLVAGPEHVTADLAVLGRLAAARLGTPQPRPAPLYLRAADAAPSSDPPTVILDEA